MPDIVISEFMDEASVDSLRSDWSVVYDPGLVDRPEDMIALLNDAQALIVRNRTQVRGRLLDAAPCLRVVGRLGVGLDNIDVQACQKRSIAVRPASGANDLSVAEYVVCTAMMLLRRSYGAFDAMVSGNWPRNSLIGREVAGKVLGLVGFGAIARETARRFKSLGMEVVACDPFVPAEHPAWSAEGVTRVGWEDFWGRADVISLHVPLSEGTRHLVNAGALAKMKPQAVLINTARGGVVDESALVDALRNGLLGGAALDVFETEPLTAAAGSRFAGVPNLILTPHIAGVTEESNVRVSKATAANVRAVLGGEMAS